MLACHGMRFQGVKPDRSIQWPWVESVVCGPKKAPAQIQHELEECLAWMHENQSVPEHRSTDPTEKRLAFWMNNVRKRSILSAMQRQDLDNHVAALGSVDVTAKTQSQIQHELDECLAWIRDNRASPSQRSNDPTEKRFASWIRNARQRYLSASQCQQLDNYLAPFEILKVRGKREAAASQAEAARSSLQQRRPSRAGPEVSAAQVTSTSTTAAAPASSASVPAGIAGAVDHSRCRARVTAAGVFRQCARVVVSADALFCKQHQKSLPYGTVEGEMEPAVFAKLAASLPRGRKTRGFRWYSRLKLWDQAQLLGKLPEALTDAEYEQCLYAIDRYFAMHAAVRHAWHLHEWSGPQSATDRQNKDRHNYLGSPNRFMWFSSTIFFQELHALAPGSTLLNVTEPLFMQALQRTSVRAANHSVVRNYLQPYSGPQCFCQRHDNALFLLEPSTVSQRAPLRAKDFAWLYCDAPDCGKARRVDLATLRLFANSTWLREERDARIAAFLVCFPSLPRVLDSWRERSSGTAPALSSPIVQRLCEENGLFDALLPGHRRALCEYISEYCSTYTVSCDPEILTHVEQAWNAESGPSFNCSALCDCSCAMADDWVSCHEIFPLSEYSEDMHVTLAWTPDGSIEEKMQNAKVLRVHGGDVSVHSEERVVVKLIQEIVSAQEVHLERCDGEATWRCVPEPWITDKWTGERRRLNLRGHLESGALPERCYIISEDFVPLRTARLHVELRKKPLEAVQEVQDIMGSLVYFTCRECRVRFPAFHPKHEERVKGLKLQVPRRCSNSVAIWDEVPEGNAILAARCSGLCQDCADDLAKVQNDSTLNGVVCFGRRNAQDPLAGFPAMDEVASLSMQVQELFRSASVLESMLVALNHMQVSVCTFASAKDTRTGLPRFRKNIISFPQHVSDLQQHMSFLASVAVHDIVNVDTARGIVRARVLEVLPDGFLVRVGDEPEPRHVNQRDVQSRMRLPWKPVDLQHSLIVLRRRRGVSDEYVEDLRVRRNFVVALLRCLTRLGHWRQHRGEEPMHAYYTEFDWLPEEEIEEILPEDGMPASLVVHDLAHEEDAPVLTRALFQEWLWEGRHDCDVAVSLLRFWATAVRGSSHDTVADYFDQLLLEYKATLSEEQQAAAEDTLPIAFLAELMKKYGRVPFDTAGMDEQTVLHTLCMQILEEMNAVQAYVNAWRGSAMAQEPERHLVADTLQDTVSNLVKPWPEIEKKPVPMYEDGRFVKAFPLEFPMGTGDLSQPCLRGDFSTADWVQHKLRYFDGRFVSSARGHRVTWAMFNTALLAASKQSGQA